jgi:hypothetical protein
MATNASLGQLENMENIFSFEEGLVCGICYEFFTNLTSTTLAAKTTDA